MKTYFLTGYKCNITFFALESLATLIVMLARNISWVAVAVFAAFFAVSFAVLFRGNKEKPLSEKHQMHLQSIAFVVVNIFLSCSFDSAQVFLYGMCFSSVVNFVFIDTKQASFQTVLSTVITSLVAAFVGFYTRSSHTMLVYTCGYVTLLVMNWVMLSVTHIICFQNRKSLEQERSLDDLLKVVEAKCMEAQDATRSKTRFLANMSHEIRTPINSVMGMNEMILRESTEDDIRSYAVEVKTAAESLLGIINDILDISKIEEGRLTTVMVKYNLPQLINDVHNLIKFRAEAKNLNFIIKVDSSLPKTVIGDDIRLKQILTNLLTNAVKYTHKGSVTFEIKPEGEGMRFSVKDTGIGIKQEDISRLFDAFDRIEEARNRSIEGTGLGLNITSSLLKLLGSELKVNSVYGKGSEFYFVLQQEVVDATPIGVMDLSSRDHVYVPYSADFIAPDARILIVDDNEINRKVFINLLKKTKVQISEATSGAECLAKTAENAYDIIFMDHMMPEMDGIETFKRIRGNKDDLCCNAPVFALTANAVMGAQEYYLQEGFDGFLSKPIDAKKLESIVLSALDDSLIRQSEEAPSSDEHNVTANAAQQNVPQPSAELPSIEGINWGYAMYNLKDEELLMETIRMFSASMKGDIKELDGYFESLEAEDAIDRYRIKVHSMKSSAALLGITPLAGMALELERAARGGDTDIILALHPVFAQRWLSYYEPVSEIVDSGEPKKNAAENMPEIYGIMAQIRCAAEEMDVDILDEMSAKLDGYSFDGEMEEKIEEIKGYILNFEVEKLASYKL